MACFKCKFPTNTESVDIEKEIWKCVKKMTKTEQLEEITKLEIIQ